MQEESATRIADAAMIIQHIPMGIMHTDPDLRVRDINPYLLDKLGMTREEVLGRRCYEISAGLKGERPEEAVPCAHCKVPLAIATGEDQTFVNEFSRDLIIETTTVPVRDESGGIVGTMELLRDITAQKKAEMELQKAHDELESKVKEQTAELRAANVRLTTLVQAIPDLVLFKDAEGRHLEVNKALVEFMGTSRAALLGKRSEDVVPPEVAEQCRMSDERALRGRGPSRFEECIGEGEERVVLDTIKSPIRDEDGNVTGLVMVSRDITERKKAEEELNKLNRELKESIGQLAAANRELESFSYSVSHDLRAPLRSIAGFSGILLKKYRDRLDEKGGDFLERIVAAAGRMDELIDDLLDLSRVTRNDMQRERVNVSEMAKKITACLQRSQPERQVTFDIAEEIFADGDAHLLHMVMDNLLGNAFKFTGKRAEALIEFGAGEREGEPVYFVRDNGAGFDMNRAAKLFQPFQRLHAMDEFPGTGIGLATVQRIIERHGGTVGIEGEKGRGTVVYFTL